MAFVINRLNENRVQLGREELMRPLPFGTAWNQVRIAALISCNATVAWTPPPTVPTIFLGLTQGQVGLFTDNTADAIGVIQSDKASWGNALTFTAQANPTISTQATAGWIMQKIGSTYTTSASSVASIFISAAPLNDAPVHSFLVVDIMKGGQIVANPLLYNFTYTYPNAAASIAANLDRATFYDRLQNPSTFTNGNAVTGTLALSGSRMHDTVCLSWGRSWPTLEVAELVAIRLG